MTAPPDISVVIPFFNEERHAGDVVREVADVLGGTGRPFELLLVDDGSSDRTAQCLLEAAGQVRGCRVLQHARNAGQAAALWNGLHAARGEVLVTLDGDGQNDPAALPAMIDRLADSDLVLGVREVRHDSPLRRAMSVLANAVRRRWLADGASDAGCALRVFRRDVIGSLIPIRSVYSFIPACASSAGFRIVEHAVAHRPRRSGSSSYGIRAMWLLPFIDMLALGWLRRRRIPSARAHDLTPGAS